MKLIGLTRPDFGVELDFGINYFFARRHLDTDERFTFSDPIRSIYSIAGIPK